MNGKIHAEEIRSLQNQINNFYFESKNNENHPPLTLKYNASNSFTTRTKSYKDGCRSVDCGALNHILEVDPVRQIAIIEPRVTMELLVKATLPFGLTVPVIPEFKEITVGGAILGMAGESASHHWGTFNDVCTAFELIIGNGTLLRATPLENSDIFYGIPGSYGTLGILVLVEIRLIPAKDFVQLRYHTFTNPFEALHTLQKLSRDTEPPDYLDGIVFAKDLAVVIEGNMKSTKEIPSKFPCFSQDSIFSKMYHQHIQKIAFDHRTNSYDEVMTLHDYFFRYDLGAFWTGAHLFNFPFLFRLIMQGILKVSKPAQDGFSKSEIQNFHDVPNPGAAFRACFRPFMSGKKLCKMLHQAEKWIQHRMLIQDFCIPENNANQFFKDILDDPGIFPIWLLPIKGTCHPQIFAPHLLSNKEQEGLFINFGIYGIPSYSHLLRI